MAQPGSVPKRAKDFFQSGGFVGMIFMLLLCLISFTIITLSVESNAIAGEGEQLPTKIYTKDTHHHLRYIKESTIALKMVTNPENNVVVFNQTYWDDCVSDSDFFRMYIDPMCLTLWMYKLQWEPVVYADMIIGVMTLAEEKEDPDARDKAMSNGGLRTYLEDGETNGYWKPCTLDTGHRETYISEIVSFWVDRFVGFFHTPPVVPRYFSVEDIDELTQNILDDPSGDREVERKLNSFLHLCGSPRENITQEIISKGVEGAHVGWSPFVLKGMNSEKKRSGKFVRFADIETQEELEEVKEEWFNITNESPEEARRAAMEIMSIHMYSVIVGNLRKFDHNLFRALGRDPETADKGPYIYIDNDRSQWKIKASKLGDLKHFNPMAEICKFPKRISERILLLRTGNPYNEGKTLGNVIYALGTQIYPNIKNGPLFSRTEIGVMDKNIDFIASMIDNCVEQYGESYVFINEPWPQPEKYGRFVKSAFELAGKL